MKKNVIQVLAITLFALTGTSERSLAKFACHSCSWGDSCNVTWPNVYCGGGQGRGGILWSEESCDRIGVSPLDMKLSKAEKEELFSRPECEYGYNNKLKNRSNKLKK